jgi:hypothetical protein
MFRNVNLAEFGDQSCRQVGWTDIHKRSPRLLHKLLTWSQSSTPLLLRICRCRRTDTVETSYSMLDILRGCWGAWDKHQSGSNVARDATTVPALCKICFLTPLVDCSTSWKFLLELSPTMVSSTKYRCWRKLLCPATQNSDFRTAGVLYLRRLVPLR